MKKSKTMTVDIRNCARCRGNHEHLVFSEMQVPCEEYTYWAMCPVFHEPILMKVDDDSIPAKFLPWPQNKPKKNGRYMLLLWDGYASTNFWVDDHWSLHRPSAILAFAAIPKMKKSLYAERKRLLELHGEGELEKEMEELNKLYKPRRK